VPPGSAPSVGVLALQGAFHAHQQRFAEIDVATRQVRVPTDLDGLDALVIPGGESTTMSRLLVTSGLFDAIETRIADGLSVLGTCAGMIMLASEVLDGRPDQRCLGAIDLVVRRNGYGRQLDSFETDLRLCSVAADGPPVPRGVHPRAARRAHRARRRGARRARRRTGPGSPGTHYRGIVPPGAHPRHEGARPVHRSARRSTPVRHTQMEK
jgi:pyridoxal 5'-phosphate synthase glutaminase subunit Pdx2